MAMVTGKVMNSQEGVGWPEAHQAAGRALSSQKCAKWLAVLVFHRWTRRSQDGTWQPNLRWTEVNSQGEVFRDCYWKIAGSRRFQMCIFRERKNHHWTQIPHHKKVQSPTEMQVQITVPTYLTIQTNVVKEQMPTALPENNEGSAKS